MTVGYKPDHRNHVQAFTDLLQTAKECNVKLNYDKLQDKQNEVEFFDETYPTSGCKPSKDKVTAITSMSSPTNKKQVQSFIGLAFIGMINYLAKFPLGYLSLQNQSESLQMIRYHSTGVLNIRKLSYI